MSVATKIKSVRLEKGMTRAEVAVKLDMSERQVFRLESGDTPVRRVHILALAEILGVSPEDLEDAA